ncbi:primosomal protein N' [Actinoplanes sp. NPDC048791]|uniref:primosomal protein N' family DNA-binding protein n=1 Tax=Actinoplanes sp. NPDC048791 TaxID=3154623 RepID=UPI00340CBA04
MSVEVPLAHLDRPFDYLVSAADDEAAQPGVRVKVRFAGQLVNGFLLERAESSPHGGKLAFLDKVVSPERVLDPEVARLARAVADRYAGNLSDVLRLAVPPRHARAEAQATPPPVDPPPGSATASSLPAGVDAAGASDRPEVAAAASAEVVGVSVAMSSSHPAAAGGAVALGRPDRATPAFAFATAGAVASAPSQTTTSPTVVPDLSDQSPSAGAQQSDPGAEPGSAGGRSVQPGTVAEVQLAQVAEDQPTDAELDQTAARGDVRPEAGAHGWGIYPTGGAFMHALEQARPARAVWSALPGEDWPARIAEAARAVVRGGRGVVIVVPDARDLERLDQALTVVLGDGRHVALNAAAGPAERYRRFLAASRHRVPVVVGTRAAMFAPVADLGLVVIWDDGDDLHAEPRAPYPHARDVLLTRAQLADCAALVGGFARTGEAQLLLETGWAKEIVADRGTLRARSPAIAPTGDDPQLARDPGAVTARLPSLAWQAARGALQAGMPVLVQVPRRGYLPSTACAECRTPARCPHCSGPLGLAGSRDVPACHWCGRAAADYACPACGGRRLRASVTGARRTAEELGRAFPGFPVRTSGRDEILTTVPGTAAVVVATPGAEPVAEGGYGAVLLLDTWALLSRADLRAAEETMRRWLSAAALARPGPAGGRVVVVADGSLAPVQALLRWDPGWFAARELAERRELGFPPAARMASVTGKAEAVAEFLDAARLPDDVELLGPVPAADDQERMLLRVSRGRAAALARALHEAAAVRSVKKSNLPIRIQIDPAELL